tara:strand:+ start:209 stop:997 length:789 start_codon:yes stop_codon:yes gene_type:complete
MNKLWKIIIDNGNFAFVDLEKITHDEWVNDDGWARYKGIEGFKPLTCKSASITYFENFYQNDCKEERGSDYERKGCFIKEGDVVVDVGANIGCFTRYALTKNPSRVLCFEPFSLNVECLKYNTEDTICEIYEKAVSDSCEPIKLLGSYDFSGGSNIIDNPGDGTYNVEETVECTTLDSFFDTNVIDKIDFLKIDVEGAEDMVLNGISVDNLKKVDRMAVEMHFEYIDDDTKQKMMDKINEAGFNNLFMFNATPTLSIYHWWR